MLLYPAFSLEKAIPKGEPHRVYGTLGDAHLQREIRRALIGALLDDDSRDFNFDELDGESAKVADVLGACGNLPFLSDRRVVLVRRAEKIENIGRSEEKESAKKDAKAKGPSAAKRLADGLKTLPPTTVLILQRTPETPETGAKKETPRLINAAVDKAIEEKIVIKATEAQKKEGHKDEEKPPPGVIFDCLVGPKNSGLATAAVGNYAAKENIQLEKGAAEFLVARIGTDIARCFSELEKCSLRAGNSPVSRATIEEMTARQPAETVFDLVDALATRQHARALQLLHELVEGGEPEIRLMALITSHFRQLVQARALLDARISLDASTANRIPPALGAHFPQGKDNLPNQLTYQTWKGPKLAAQARQFSSSQLHGALEAAFEFDLAVKGIAGDGGADSKSFAPLMLDLFVAKLA